MEPDVDANRAARKSEESQDSSFDADSDPAPAGTGGDLAVEPEPGGYAGRDPKTEMPSVPSVPEPEQDSGEFGGQPDDRERPSDE